MYPWQQWQPRNRHRTWATNACPRIPQKLSACDACVHSSVSPDCEQLVMLRELLDATTLPCCHESRNYKRRHLTRLLLLLPVSIELSTSPLLWRCATCEKLTVGWMYETDVRVWGTIEIHQACDITALASTRNCEYSIQSWPRWLHIAESLLRNRLSCLTRSIPQLTPSMHRQL